MNAELQSVQGVPEAASQPIDAEGRQWAHLLPAGLARTRDGRGPYSAPDPASIIAASFAERNSAHIPVDYDHAMDLAAPKGLPAPAAGWITEMKVRDDGIWGLIKWTKRALNAIEDREYRFLSPAIRVRPDKTVVSIAGASLVNDPNLTLKALNSAERDRAMTDDEAWSALRAELELPNEADAAAILQAVKDLRKSMNSVDPSKFVPFDTFQATVAELGRVRSGISLHAAERAVEAALEGGKIHAVHAGLGRRTLHGEQAGLRLLRGAHRTGHGDDLRQGACAGENT